MPVTRDQAQMIATLATNCRPLDEVRHYVCAVCNPDVAVCGFDVSHRPPPTDWRSTDQPCVVCHEIWPGDEPCPQCGAE